MTDLRLVLPFTAGGRLWAMTEIEVAADGRRQSDGVTLKCTVGPVTDPSDDQHTVTVRAGTLGAALALLMDAIYRTILASKTARPGQG